MIHYMPFTYLSQDLIGRLASTVGSFAVCQVAEKMLPLAMQPWVEKGVIIPQRPEGMNPDHVQKAVEAFTQWGEVHQDRLAAMASLYSDGRDRTPGVDDSAPTRISNLIRHYERDENHDAWLKPDPMFRAALFLAMAQSHDEHQDAVSGAMADVHRMEAQLAVQLNGDPDAGLPQSQLPEGGAGAIDGPDRGELWIDQRVSAWAMLASRLAPAHLYLTTNLGALEALTTQLPGIARLGQQRMSLNHSCLQAHSPTGEETLGCLAEFLATAPDPLRAIAAWEPVMPDQPDGCRNQTASALISLWAVPGQSPNRLLADLSHQSPVDLSVKGPEIRNMVIGYLVI